MKKEGWFHSPGFSCLVWLYHKGYKFVCNCDINCIFGSQKNVIHQFSEKIDSCIDNRPVCSCYGYRMKILSFSPSEPHEQLQDNNHVVYPEEKTSL